MRIEMEDRPRSSLRLDQLIVVRRVRSTKLWSRFVWLMRGVLPGAVLGLFVLLVAWPSLMVPDERVQIGKVDRAVGLDGVDALTMVNPRYYGVDVSTRPYSVSAEKANHTAADSGLIMLDKPRADTVMKDGAGVLLDADRGRYYHTSQKIDLFGNVNVYHDKGYEMHTEEARMDLAAGTAEGDKPVQGHGPSMQLEGDGFRLADRGRTIFITGNSRMVIYPPKKSSQQ